MCLLIIVNVKIVSNATVESQYTTSITWCRVSMHIVCDQIFILPTIGDECNLRRGKYCKKKDSFFRCQRDENCNWKGGLERLFLLQ